MKKSAELVGERFARLLVLKREGRDKYNRAMWLCLCDCGNEKILPTALLRRGVNKSCGCLQAEAVRSITHGHTSEGISPTYRSWISMKTRCKNKKSDNYQRYGGRGIEICDRWLNSFENFYADMGERPEGTSLDRIDPDSNYEPSNCRWAGTAAQSRNRSEQKAVCGVALQQSGNWRATIGLGNKRISLGTFASHWDAICARKSAENRFWAQAA